MSTPDWSENARPPPRSSSDPSNNINNSSNNNNNNSNNTDASTSMCRLLLTAVGAAPELRDSDTPSSHEEEEFWIAHADDQVVAETETHSHESSASAPAPAAAAAGATGAGHVVGLDHSSGSPVAAGAAGVEVGRRVGNSGVSGAGFDYDGGHGAARSSSRLLQLDYPRVQSEVVMAGEGMPQGGETARSAGGDNRDARRRRRRRMFGNSDRQQQPSRMFRPGNRALFNALNGRGRGGEMSGGSMSGSSRPRSVGREGNGAEIDDPEGGGGGRILFYHKPTLANVPAGDIPDVVPVYLGCPNGGMALGLPLNEAWQGGAQQDTTFNQNLSYTILSWPERHAKDVIELQRSQVLFLTAMIFNILVAGLLYWVENADRTRVEVAARAGSFPGPFERRSSADLAYIAASKEQHLLAVMLIGLWGVLSVIFLNRTGILLYLCMAVISVILGLGAAPDALLACRYFMDIVLIVIGRTLLSSLTYAWVTASAGDGNRG